MPDNMTAITGMLKGLIATQMLLSPYAYWGGLRPRRLLRPVKPKGWTVEEVKGRKGRDETYALNGPNGERHMFFPREEDAFFYGMRAYEFHVLFVVKRDDEDVFWFWQEEGKVWVEMANGEMCSGSEDAIYSLSDTVFGIMRSLERIFEMDPGSMTYTSISVENREVTRYDREEVV